MLTHQHVRATDGDEHERAYAPPDFDRIIPFHVCETAVQFAQPA
jgi:hypothetical protein